MTTIFIDLDETLVQTTRLEEAAKLFGFGISGSHQERMLERTIFKQILQRYLEGDKNNLELLASNQQIVFLDTKEDTRNSRQSGILVSQLRPQTIHFLNQIKSLGFKANILTAGKLFFQSGVLEKHGIQNYFTKIFGREDISHAKNYLEFLSKDDDLLLIDDLPPGSIGFIDKFSALGLTSSQTELEDEEIADIVDKYYIQVIPYFGGTIDSELVNIIPAITQKLNR